MCKIILNMGYVVTCHIYHNLRYLISLYSNYIYSDTCVTGFFLFQQNTGEIAQMLWLVIDLLGGT
jgi:hypothetical protein